MFKKEQQLAERARSVLKNKEVRQLRSDVLTQFPSLTEDQINLLLPNKAHVTCVKLANRSLLYLRHGEAGDALPYFIDVEGRRNIFPSVYALWECPSLCPSLHVPAPVSEFIINGADLMLPGVLGDVGDVSVGDKRCVIARGNPLPFAVGEMLVDTAYLQTRGKKGKGLRVVHFFGDLLWTMGGCAYPNEGFGRTAVFPLYSNSTPNLSSAHVTTTDVTEIIVREEIQIQDMETVPLYETAGALCDPPGADVDVAQDTMQYSQVNDVDLDLDVHREDESDGGSNIKFDDAEDDDEKSCGSAAVDLKREVPETLRLPEEVGVDEEVLSASTGDEKLEELQDGVDMDELLLVSFMRAVKYACKDKQLPILASTFYSVYLLPARPHGSTIEVKRSSFKKVTKFLQHMQRQGLVTLQDNNGVVSISAVNRSSPDYLAFRATDAGAIREAVEEAQGLGSREESAPPGYVICALFKLTKPMKELFGVCHGQYGEYLKADEAKSVLMCYVRNRELEMPDRARVRVDPHLCDLLYKKKKKSSTKAERRELRSAAPVNQDTSPAAVDYPEDVSKEELIKEFMANLPEYHALISSAFSDGIHIGSGALPKVEMLLETRQGNKVVTRVSGLEAFGISCDAFARDCQRKFACSATASQITGKKTKEVVVQGHLSVEMKEWLVSRYGVPQRLVEIEIRKGVKPKKKSQAR